MIEYYIFDTAIFLDRLFTLSFTACTENFTQSKEANNTNTGKTNTAATNESVTKPCTKEVVTHYLHLRNALAADNSKDAANTLACQLSANGVERPWR